MFTSNDDHDDDDDDVLMYAPATDIVCASDSNKQERSQSADLHRIQEYF